MKNKLEILYEDNHIIVVVKPINILSQQDDTKDIDMLTIIKSYIKEKYQKTGNVYLGLVHRLDRVVGGVMVFAKTSKAASRLSESIRKSEFSKIYLTVVKGKLDKKGEYIDYLKKNDDYSTSVVKREDGKYSKLTYELLEYNKTIDLSLAKVFLETGRHHQIRVQFKNHDHPVYGDKRYGKSEGDIGLYAYSLSFPHPITHEMITFKSTPKHGVFKNFTVN